MRKAHFLAFHQAHASRSSRSAGCASMGSGSSTSAPSTSIQGWKASAGCRVGGMSMQRQDQRVLSTSLSSSATSSCRLPSASSPCVSCSSAGATCATTPCSMALAASFLYSYLRQRKRSAKRPPCRRSFSVLPSAPRMPGSSSGQRSGKSASSWLRSATPSWARMMGGDCTSASNMFARTTALSASGRRGRGAAPASSSSGSHSREQRFLKWIAAAWRTGVSSCVATMHCSREVRWPGANLN